MEKCKFTGKDFDCKNCKGHKEDWLNRGKHLIHMSFNITTSVLNMDTQKDWKEKSEYITDSESGGYMSPIKIRNEFIRMYNKGFTCFPLDSKCDNFCFKNGCQGHQTEDQKKG